MHNRYRSSQPSGENVVVEDEARLLAEHGCTVERLELTSDEIASWGPAKKALLPARVVWSTEGYELTRRAIRAFQPRVVHFHNTFPLFSPSALWAARGAGVRIVQTLHNFRPLCPSADFLRNGRVCELCLGRIPLPAVVYGCYRDSRLATIPVAATNSLHRLLGTWVRCVDIFIAPSGFTRAKYIEAGWPPEKLVVKYNTVAAASNERDPNPRGFVCVSRLTREKGVAVLLDAWRAAFPDGGEGLEIIGSGDSEAVLRQTAETIRGVSFRGQLPREDVMRALGRARAAVMPSLCYEVFPQVIGEAFASGTPVIASRIGALAEVVNEGANGLLAQPGSSADTSRALTLIAGSDDLTRVLGHGAREQFQKKFNPVVTTAQLISIYEAPVKRPSPLRRRMPQERLKQLMSARR